MRISPVLLLLPVLVALGACTQTVPSAIANEDRPVSTQPAIASPVAAPLTIESLAGTYKGTVDKQWYAKIREALKKDGLDDASLQSAVMLSQQTLEKLRITINTDGTFEAQEFTESGVYGETQSVSGKVRLDKNKLMLTVKSAEPIKVTDNLPKVPRCDRNCTLTLYISADGKTLMYYDPKNHNAQNLTPFFRGYVKQ